MNYNMIFDIEPQSAPRMVRSDRWAKRPVVVRYFAYRDNIQLLAKLNKYKLTPVVDVVFYVTMPKSWSEKKRNAMIGEPHQQKPDIDNLCKAFLDCLETEDSYVWKITAEKRWSDRGYIKINQYKNP